MKWRECETGMIVRDTRNGVLYQVTGSRGVHIIDGEAVVTATDCGAWVESIRGNADGVKDDGLIHWSHLEKMDPGLAPLVSEITEGWTVEITNHCNSVDSRDHVTVERVNRDGLTLRARRPWVSQGRKFPTMNFTWDSNDVADGRKVRSYGVGTGITSRTRPGERYLASTFTFAPPRPS